MRFLKRLKEMHCNFDLEKAEALSTEIHEAEEKGYEISAEEDRLWMQLTDVLVALRGGRISKAG